MPSNILVQVKNSDILIFQDLFNVNKYANKGLLYEYMIYKYKGNSITEKKLYKYKWANKPTHAR